MANEAGHEEAGTLPGRTARHTVRARRSSSLTRLNEGRLVFAATEQEEELRLLREALPKYDVIERVDSGGQGAVYLARQKGAERIVALKVLLGGPLATERQRFRFEREIELISRLQHPNIVALYDCGVVRGRLYFTMEFVAGLPIDDYALLHDLSPKQIVALVVKVARAVHYAHQRGVIHRDLKPQNILVDDAGEPRVFDFGLAKDVGGEAAESPYSVAGMVMGTFPYLSPEQASGFEGAVDVRSDVYTLGLILYELLTDLFPYPVDGPADQVRRSIVAADPLPLRRAVALGAPDRAPRLHEINRDLEAVLARALAKSRQDRYQSAADLADDLQRYLDGAAVQARSASALYVVRKLVRRHRVAVGVSALVAATFLAAGLAVTLAYFEARAQRDTARQATGKALDLYDLALREVQEAVRPLPGGVEVRNRLIDRLSAELPRLTALAGSGGGLEPIAAALLTAQGDIALEQGRLDEAAAHFRDSLRTWQRLAAAHPDEIRYRDEVSESYLRLARSQSRPLQTLEEGIRHATAAAASPSAGEASRLAACRLLHQYAFYIARSREDAALRDILDSAFAMLPADAVASGTDRNWGRVAADLLVVRARIETRSGNAEAASESLRTATAIRERLAQTFPADVDVLCALMDSYTQLAAAEWNDARPASAIAQARKATEIGDLLERVDPTSSTSDRERYSVHHDLAHVYLTAEQIEDAREHARRALLLADRMEANGCYYGATAAGRARIVAGNVELNAGRVAAAYSCFNDAHARFTRLLAADPENDDHRRNLATACYWLGTTRRTFGDLESSEDFFKRALADWTLLAARQPESVEFELSRVEALINLASVLLRHDTPEHDRSARELLEQSRDAFVALDRNGKLKGEQRRRRMIEKSFEDNFDVLDARALRIPGAASTSPRPAN